MMCRILLFSCLLVCFEAHRLEAFQRSGRSGRSSRSEVEEKQADVTLGGTDISEAEARRFMDRYIALIVEGRPQDANGMIDWKAITERATDISEVNADQELRTMRRDFTTGVMSSINTKGITIRISEELNGGGGYRLLRVFEQDGERRAMVRLLPATGGFNYHNYRLERDGEDLKLTEVYIAVTGETFAETLRRNFLPLIGQWKQDRGDEELNAKDEAFLRNFRRLEQINNLTRRGDPQGAERIYQSLPEELRTSKTVMISRIMYALDLGEDVYREAIDEFRELYPNDPAVDMMSIDGYVLRRQFDKALKAIDRIEKTVGDDPHLDSIRSGLYFEQGDLKQAKKYANLAIAAEPELLPAYWQLVSISLEDKDYDSTLDLLKTIEKDFGIAFVDLRNIPVYAGFVKSPQFKKWEAREDAVMSMATPDDSAVEVPASSSLKQGALELNR